MLILFKCLRFKACRLTLRNVGELLDAKELNIRIQYELEEFHQLNYETFVHDFTKIAVSYLKLNLFRNLLNLSLSVPRDARKSLQLH